MSEECQTRGNICARLAEPKKLQLQAEAVPHLLRPFPSDTAATIVPDPQDLTMQMKNVSKVAFPSSADSDAKEVRITCLNCVLADALLNSRIFA